MIHNLNNKAITIKLNPFYGKKSNLSENIKHMLNEVLKHAKADVSDEKRYATVVENFANNDKSLNYKSLTFVISQDSDKSSGHMLEVVMPHPKKEIGIKRPLAYGSKEQIVSFLEKADSVKSVQKDIEEMNKELLSY